ncbi:MAG: translocation/assembly module TamB domain-containing protein [Flavipsychrobacter sp.]
MLLLVVLINFTPVQNFIVKKATSALSDKLNTTVEIKHIRIDLLNHVLINGIYIEDQHNDTLLYAGEIRLRVSDWFMISSAQPVIKYVGLHDAFANLYRTDSSGDWNYQFIADAFASNKPKDTTKKKQPIDFDINLKEVDLSNIRFFMNDAWVGSDMNFTVGKFHINAREVDLKKKIIDIADIKAANTEVVLRDYDGGRPPKPKKAPKPYVFSPFNTDEWKVILSSLNLDNCIFRSDVGKRKPYDNEFDPAHILASNVDADITDVTIVGDTIKAQLNNLAAKERSGIEIRSFRADVTVSPNASICDNLLLETNNSVVRDYYAMRYNRFPDFIDFIDKVSLDAHFKKTSVDINDIAYFATVLRDYPVTIDLSGEVKGPVSNLKTKDLYITDGISSVSGDLSIKGLPDINNTFFDYKNGEIYTNGKGIAIYAPSLKDSSSTIAIDSLTDFHFAGNYSGTIQAFVFDGTITSNLGNITSNIKLDMPKGISQNATYSGELLGENLKLGVLFNTKDLGTTSFKTTISGKSLDFKESEVRLDALIDHFDYKGYRYNNISADGVLARKKFEGNLLVSDDNLLLGFYGALDYSSDTVQLKAKANLLSSNLTAINIVKDDTVKAVADFDLNCSGSSIDNFVGYAKLYNIDITRSGSRIDLDSISVISTINNNEKHLKVESNAIYADLLGDYTLSSLNESFQYYIAGYLPAYIKRSEKDVPHQDFSFKVRTREFNKLVNVLDPNIDGFNNVSFSGSLSTKDKNLKLSGNIPYGKFNNLLARNATIKSNGNFQQLDLTLDIDKVIVGDSVITGSLDVTTTLGNNELGFTIKTSTPDIIGTAKLSGKAIAQNDSLLLSIFDSEFYLNNTRWEIPSGNKITFSEKLLLVDNFNIQSGLQHISVNSQNNGTTQTILAKINNLDIAQIGSIIGMADYEPEGRINGQIELTNVLSTPNISSNIKMNNVKLGTDTLGNIVVIGSYNGKKHIINLDRATGITYQDKSLNVFGDISFDSLNNEKIDGNITFNKVPISWATSFLKGNISELGGNIDGSISIKGTSSKPDIDGAIQLFNATLRVDVLGTNYKIPTAKISVDNKKIDLGKINIYDIYDNEAQITGGIYHNRFKNVTLGISATSQKFEVINLESDESDVFYGTFIAGFKELSITGPTNDVDIRIVKASPAAKSHLYLPLASSAGLSNYNYIKFKTYGKEQEDDNASRSKLNIHIEAVLNPLGEVTMVMDPTTGDAINAKGTGNLIIDMPSSNDFKMYGAYVIEDGSYIFTLKQLFLKRQFQLNKGSVIRFNGAVYETGLDVEGVYRTRARLYDLLSSKNKESLANAGSREIEQTKMMRDVDVLLFMRGTLGSPELNFQIELPDNTAQGTLAYQELKAVNQNDQKLLNEVASLLLINTFISSEGGIEGSSATGGAINNISDILSSTASTQLTNLVSKITGDEDLSISLKYKTYNYNTGGSSTSTNRNEVSIGLKKNYFDDRLSVEVGSALDWGRQSSSSSGNNFKPVGDFRVQYLIREGGNLRANIFRTSSYDIFVDRNISRAGVGLSWRKSFNNFGDLFRGSKYIDNKKKEKEKKTTEQK